VRLRTIHQRHVESRHRSNPHSREFTVRLHPVPGFKYEARVRYSPKWRTRCGYLATTALTASLGSRHSDADKSGRNIGFFFAATFRSRLAPPSLVDPPGFDEGARL
jgi:hypothetical protein